MREKKMEGRTWQISLLGLGFLLLGMLIAAEAVAAERHPYEFDPPLSLTGGCGTSKADPIPDPGCPEKKPPKAFSRTTSIAIDSFGNEYVANYGAEEGKDGRIDIFSPKGVFISEVKDEFGPKNLAVDSEGNLYTFDQSPGHNAEFALYKPTVYKPGEEKIEYGNPRKLIDEKVGPSTGGVTVDANDHVFVDWAFSIKEYSSAKEENKLLNTITNEKLQSSAFIALDRQRRRLYASSCPNGKIVECWILVFNADKPYELLEEIEGPNPPTEKFVSGKGWISIAVNEESGDFFVGDLELSKNVYQFNEKYELVSKLAIGSEVFENGEPLEIAISNAKSAFNHEYLFVPSNVPKNRANAFHPPVEFEPEIVSVSATGISEEEAELQATITPDGGETTYRFEYLSQQEYEEGGETFAGAELAGEGTILPTEQEAEVKAPISGLSPETEYRFLVSAENNAGPAKPKEGTFTTYNDAPGTSNCENQSLRTGYSALLPDCRAYELVTPADTNGQSPSGINAAGDNFPSVKVSPDGKAVTFLTHGGSIPGLGGAGASNGDQYLTTRGPSGWNTELAAPDGTASTLPDPGSTSPDQGYSFWEATGEGSAVIEGGETRYVRYPDGHLASVGRGSLGTDPRARGNLITENGTHIIFETNPVNVSDKPIQLEPEAAPTGTKAVYDRTADEVTHVISLLPGDESLKAGQNAAFVGASGDGEGIAFSVGNELYLRVGDETTYEIGEGVTFAGVAESGSRIFFVDGGNLIAFDTATEKEIDFTETGNAVPVNVAPDGTRAYFLSTTAISGSGENPQGASAEPGQQNLYLSEEGTIRFVATVTKRDVEGEEGSNIGQIDGLGLWTLGLKEQQPTREPSRVNPDGSVLLFSSRANLDGYDPEGAPEIYRYDSVGNRLHCISCIPTELPATGGASFISFLTDAEAPPPFILTNVVSNLRADGKRVFFQSTEALVSRDNDGVQDIYEWEEQGVGSCTRAGGCVYLITSGHTPKNNYLYGVSGSGDDVFFTTPDVLVGGDDDTLSIYDARVGGGFTKEPCQVGGCCEKGDCRPNSPPPPLVAPVTNSTGPSGNVPSVKPCAKGKHRVKRNGREVCVKNKKKHHRKRNKAKGGTGK